MSDVSPQTTVVVDDQPKIELPVGTKLDRGRYSIVRRLASGGFGITYIAKDNLQRKVAIKECFPLGLATRSRSVTVSPAGPSTTDGFTTARNQFLKEARLLAGLTHPNVVHVQTLFEENGTAYMAMDFIEGKDLHSIITQDRNWLTPRRIEEIVRVLLGALAYLHADHADNQKCLHRDIKPANIIINQFGIPMLIDFGAAKQETQNLSRQQGTFRVVSDGYSPNEFYVRGLAQGDGSDLYSLAATAYHAITGEAPVSADTRAAQMLDGSDPYIALGGRFPEYNPGLIEMIDRSLSMLLKERPANAQEWLDAMGEGDLITKTVVGGDLVPPPAPVEPPPPEIIYKSDPAALRKRFMGGTAAGAAVLTLLFGTFIGLEAGGVTGVFGNDAAVQTRLDETSAALDQTRTDLAAAERDLRDAEAQVASLEAALPPINWAGNWSFQDNCGITQARSATFTFGGTTNDGTLTARLVTNNNDFLTMRGTQNGRSVDWRILWPDGRDEFITFVPNLTGDAFTAFATGNRPADGACVITGSRI